MDAPAMHLDAAPITLVSRSELLHNQDGPTRGYAHVGLDGHPPGAPGRLDLDPLLLVAHGEMHPGEGFPMHRHEHIDNILLMLEGELDHEDSDGRRAVLGPDGIMVMSAGSGAEHAELVRGDRSVRALVIWLRPDDPDAPPAVALAHIPRDERRNCLRTIASTGGGMTGALRLRSRSLILTGALEAGTIVRHRVEPGRRGYLMATDGAVRVGARQVAAGDRVLVPDGGELVIEALEPTDVVLLDLP